MGFSSAAHKRESLGLLKHVSCWEALADLPGLDGGLGTEASDYRPGGLTPVARHLRRGGAPTVRDHVAMALGQDALDLRRHVPRGGTWRDIPAHLLPERFAGMRRTDSTNLYGRLDPSRPSYTINTQFMNVTTGCYTHPYEDRALTKREGARLQTFPDRYQFTSNATSRARMIGNAVPCLMGSVLGARIAEHLSGSRSKTVVAAPLIRRRRL